LTLTALAARVGVHHSALRRYFASHKDLLLRIAAEGWRSWAERLESSLDGRTVAPGELGPIVAWSLLDDPLFCDLLANTPLHLEHEVAVERVIEFKRSSRESVARLSAAIAAATPALGESGALDVVTAANALAATLWQVGHPAPPLSAAMEEDPTLSLVGPADYRDTFSRLLTATCVGMASTGGSEQ
jgi:AcrR family transcriptional regulator